MNKYYVVMLKEGEKYTEVLGTDRQFLTNHWHEFRTVFNRLKNYKGNIEQLKGIQRMEVYTFSNFFDDRTFRLVATEY